MSSDKLENFIGQAFMFIKIFRILPKITTFMNESQFDDDKREGNII